MVEARKEYIPTGLSVYEYLEEKSKNFAELPAITFYGFKVSYEKLFRKIDEMERALRAWGVQKDDIVAASLPGIPEAMYIIYAINKIGAKYCAFDCRCEAPEVKDTLKTFNPKLCIIPDFQLMAVEDVHDHTIIYIDPAHTVGGPMNVIDFFTNIRKGRTAMVKKHKNIFKYDDFLAKQTEGENLPPEKSSDGVFGYFYTSGTTYGRKSIILTNENINSTVMQVATSEDYVRKGERMLNIMPLFTCYGWTIATHLPLSLGVHISLIPVIKPQKLKKILLREKPNFIITVPAHWEYFVDSDFEGCDLSFLKTVIVGGDKVSPKYEEKINSIFKSCGSDAFLRIGYGLSETTSMGGVPNKETPKGSVGRPLEYMTCGIFDRETLEELPPYEQGEICLRGPSVCSGYYKDQEMTDRLLRQHPDGTVWLHSGDIGYLDENGYIYFCERIKRMYVRFDGTKISPFSIENIIMAHDDVAHCLVVPIQDTDHTHGMCAKAMIVLRGGVEDEAAKERVQKYMNANLGQHMIPKEVVYMEKLPYTKNGKLDAFADQAKDTASVG